MIRFASSLLIVLVTMTLAIGLLGCDPGDAKGTPVNTQTAGNSKTNAPIPEREAKAFALAMQRLSSQWTCADGVVETTELTWQREKREPFRRSAGKLPDAYTTTVKGTWRGEVSPMFTPGDRAEVHDLICTITPSALDAADSLNRVEWRGEITFRYGAIRYGKAMGASVDWQNWIPPSDLGGNNVAQYRVTFSNGQWTLE